MQARFNFLRDGDVIRRGEYQLARVTLALIFAGVSAKPVSDDEAHAWAESAVVDAPFWLLKLCTESTCTHPLLVVNYVLGRLLRQGLPIQAGFEGMSAFAAAERLMDSLDLVQHHVVATIAADSSVTPDISKFIVVGE